MDKQVRQVSSSARSGRRSWPLLPVRRRGSFVEPHCPIATAVPTATTIPGRRVPPCTSARPVAASSSRPGAATTGGIHGKTFETVRAQASAGMGNSRCSAEATSDPCTTTSVTATPAQPAASASPLGRHARAVPSSRSWAESTCAAVNTLSTCSNGGAARPLRSTGSRRSARRAT